MKDIIYSLFQPIFATYPGVYEFHSVLLVLIAWLL